MKHPIENWFRPPVEFVPATISALSAITVSVAPAFFALPGQVALGIGATWVAHSGWRLRQGLRITKFHSNLRRLPVYVCSADDILWSREKLFLGSDTRAREECA